MKQTHLRNVLQAAEAFADPNGEGILLCAHGLINLGATLREAEYAAEWMEESGPIDWNTHLIT